ncbi:hypothetical protein ACX0G9_15515 [Flavitalea flava]
MYEVQYFVPSGYSSGEAALDDEIMAMCSKLKNVDTKGDQVPNSALSVQLKVMHNGTILEIKKRGQLVFINLFCFETQDFQELFALVENLYSQLKLGAPKRPKMPTWIHSIPIDPAILRENERILCHKMTLSFFWAVYAQHLKKSNTLN